MNLYIKNQKYFTKKKVLVYDINQNSYSNVTNSMIKKKITKIQKKNNYKIKKKNKLI